MSASFICQTCGEEHSGLPLDYSFSLPDEVFALDFVARYLRSRSNSDLCTLDESRYFIRGVIPLPFTDTQEEYCWGVWLEVSSTEHEKYVRGYNDDLSAEPSFTGRLANGIPGYPDSLGLEFIGTYSGSGSRPTFSLPQYFDHLLAHDQHNGIDATRHHEILTNVGHFKRGSTAA